MEEAVCFGWVDSTMQSVDVEKFVLRFSPRRKGAVWAVSNIRRVKKMIAEGKMTLAGMATVEEAHRNGEWDAAIQRENTSKIPPDVQEALAPDEAVQRQFERLPHSHKKQYLWWIAEAKTQATRQRRIQEMIKRMEADKLVEEKKTGKNSGNLSDRS